MKWYKNKNGFVVNSDEMNKYGEQDIIYQVHSAKRHSLEENDNWVCYYEPPLSASSSLPYGYMGIKDGVIVFCGGNATFNAIGVPAVAQFKTAEEAKAVCEFHHAHPDNSRSYTLTDSYEENLYSK